MQDTTAGLEQPRQVADRHRRIEDVVQGTAVDDEVEALIDGQRQRQAEVGNEVGAFVVAQIETAVAGIRKQRIERSIGDESAAVRRAGRGIDFETGRVLRGPQFALDHSD